MPALEVISSEDVPVGVQGDDELSHKQKEGDYCQLLPNCNNTHCRATHTSAERQVINCYICPFHSGDSSSTLPTTGSILSAWHVETSAMARKRHCKSWMSKMFTWIWRFNVDSCFITYMCYQAKYLGKHGAENNKLFECLTIHKSNLIIIFILCFNIWLFDLVHYGTV